MKYIMSGFIPYTFQILSFPFYLFIIIYLFLFNIIYLFYLFPLI